MLLPHRGWKEGGKEGKGGRIWFPESPVTLKSYEDECEDHEGV